MESHGYQLLREEVNEIKGGIGMNTMIGTESNTKVGSRPSGRMAAYWAVTLILAFSIALSGIGQLMRYGGNVELVTNIGFPLYVTNILGAWKLLGVIAIVMPGFPGSRNGLIAESSF